MVKIQKIGFTEVEYDHGLSHEIVAIAEVHLSDSTILKDVLVYDPCSRSEPEDYFSATPKFSHYKYHFPDVRVKFPKTTTIEKKVQFTLAIKIVDEYWNFQSKLEMEKKDKELSGYTKEDWKKHSKSLDVYWLDRYIDKIDISVACAENITLTEEFIRKYVHKIDFESLGSNHLVLEGLSNFFIRKFSNKLNLESLRKEQLSLIYQEAERELEYLGAFSDDDAYHMGESDYFDVIYDDYEALDPMVSISRYPKTTIEEMNEIVRHYTPEDWDNVSAVWQLYWLECYEDKVNWSIISEENKYLTEAFLVKYDSKIDYEALSLNEFVKLPLSFIAENLNRFTLTRPVPCLIRVLTYDFTVKNQDKIKLDKQTFKRFFKGDIIEKDKIAELLIKDYDEFAF